MADEVVQAGLERGRGAAARHTGREKWAGGKITPATETHCVRAKEALHETAALYLFIAALRSFPPLPEGMKITPKEEWVW